MKSKCSLTLKGKKPFERDTRNKVRVNSEPQVHRANRARMQPVHVGCLRRQPRTAKTGISQQPTGQSHESCGFQVPTSYEQLPALQRLPLSCDSCFIRDKSVRTRRGMGKEYRNSYHWSISILSNGKIESPTVNGYTLITYYWTGLPILDHSYLVGNLTKAKMAQTKALAPLRS